MYSLQERPTGRQNNMIDTDKCTMHIMDLKRWVLNADQGDILRKTTEPDVELDWLEE